jgi:hypothetical protein
MTTAEEYFDLADWAYRVDRLIQDPPLHVGEEFGVDSGDLKQKYVVIDTEDHPANGFQAMAVAPLVDGVPDLSHIVVSYAGTNPEHRADVLEDVETVVGGTQGLLSQAAEARWFADRVKQEHPGSTISTAGHSLGGFLALLVAAENDWEATTFNGPDPWALLSPEVRERLEAERKAGRTRQTSYVVEWDLVGNLYPHRTGSTVFLSAEPGGDPLTYHNLDKTKMFRFNPDGSLQGTGAKGHRVKDILGNLVDSFVPGASEPLAPMLLVLEGITRDPATMRAVGKNASAALVAVNSVAALGLAASIGGTAAALTEIKAANGRIIPRMEAGLLAATKTAALMPTITAADIEHCIHKHRLHVHQNVDTEAVRAVSDLVDRHLIRVAQLSDGITRTVRHTLEQDAEWALTFGLDN